MMLQWRYKDVAMMLQLSNCIALLDSLVLITVLNIIYAKAVFGDGCIGWNRRDYCFLTDSIVLVTLVAVMDLIALIEAMVEIAVMTVMAVMSLMTVMASLTYFLTSLNDIISWTRRLFQFCNWISEGIQTQDIS